MIFNPSLPKNNEPLPNDLGNAYRDLIDNVGKQFASQPNDSDPGEFLIGPRGTGRIVPMGEDIF
jgi:hypothetical protein